MVNTILCLQVHKCSIQTVMCMLLGNISTNNTLTFNLNITGCNHLLLTSVCAWIPRWGSQCNRCTRITRTITNMGTTSISLTLKIATRNSSKSQIIWAILTLNHQSQGANKRDSIKLKVNVEMALKVHSSRLKNLLTLRDRKTIHQGLTHCTPRQGAVQKTSQHRCLCRLIQITNSQMWQR